MITIKNTENIQVTVHTSDNEVKKVTKTSIIDTKLVKKPIRRKVYLNKPKAPPQEQQHVFSKKEEENDKKLILKSSKSLEDESNFEPNYFDEEFDKQVATTKL